MHDDIFMDLVEAVEAQGGELLAEAHTPDVLEYEIKGKRGRVKKESILGAGCDQETLLRFPYEREAKGETVEMDVITLCAVDDRMDLMPRFAQELP